MLHEDSRLLIGLDFTPGTATLTPGALRAIDVALWLAEGTSMRADFLHATEEHYVESEGGIVLNERGVSDEQRATLDHVVQRFSDAEVRAQLLVSEDKPWLALIQETLRHPTGLVLVGKHAKRSEGTKIGIVAAKLMRKCPVPVWVVKPDSHAVPGSVVAATGLADVDQSVLELAGWIARRAHAPLHAVHAFHLTMEEQLAGARHGAEDPRRAHHDKAVDAITRQLEGAGMGDIARIHVACASPVKAILEAVAEFEAELLVMGTLAREGIPGLLVGNTAEKVLPRADCSLLTVKPRSFVSPVRLGSDG